MKKKTQVFEVAEKVLEVGGICTSLIGFDLQEDVAAYRNIELLQDKVVIGPQAGFYSKDKTIFEFKLSELFMSKSNE